MTWEIVEGDCVEAMAAMPEASVDAIVTDPPYGLEFMGKEWDRLGATAAPFSESLTEDGRVDYHGKGNAPFGGGGQRVRYGSTVKAMQEWHEAWTREALRVLKPGGHLLAFGGTRTYHRLACAVEDAGFEIRDCLAWLYGSGFPKSLDVSKAIDKSDAGAERRARNLRFTEWMRSTGITGRQIDVATATFMGGHYLTAREQAAVPTADMLDKLRHLLPPVPEWVEALVRERTVESENFKRREVIGERMTGIGTGGGATPIMGDSDNRDVTAPATSDAERWQGWGTALKPAHEPIVMARKPLAGTVAANVLEHGTGALNVDATRVGWGEEGDKSAARKAKGYSESAKKALGGVVAEDNASGFSGEVVGSDATAGRWPANVVLDEQAAAMLDEQTGTLTSGREAEGGHRRNGDKFRNAYGDFEGTEREPGALYGDSGGASRFLKNVRSGPRCILCGCESALPAESSSSSNAARSGSADGLAQVPQLLEHEDNGRLSGAPAEPVAVTSTITPATDRGPTALPNAQREAVEQIGRLVLSAGILCGPCTTSTAQSVALWLRGQDPESTRGPVSTLALRQQILSRSLAPLAAGLAVTGIIPTTDSLSALCGSALSATQPNIPTGETGTAPDLSESRLLYQSKASSAERNAGLDGFEAQWAPTMGNGIGGKPHDEDIAEPKRNVHPTVKPIELMRWLVRLVTPPGGLVLDPFAGSGTTGCAAVLEGLQFVGIEREAEYVTIARARIAWWEQHPEGVEIVKALEADRTRRAVRETGQLGLLDVG